MRYSEWGDVGRRAERAESAESAATKEGLSMEDFYHCESDNPERFSSEQRSREGLPRDLKQQENVQADERASVIHLNSTCVFRSIVTGDFGRT